MLHAPVFRYGEIGQFFIRRAVAYRDHGIFPGGDLTRRQPRRFAAAAQLDVREERAFAAAVVQLDPVGELPADGQRRLV